MYEMMKSNEEMKQSSMGEQHSCRDDLRQVTNLSILVTVLDSINQIPEREFSNTNHPYQSPHFSAGHDRYSLIRTRHQSGKTHTHPLLEIQHTLTHPLTHQSTNQLDPKQNTLNSKETERHAKDLDLILVMYNPTRISGFSSIVIPEH